MAAAREALPRAQATRAIAALSVMGAAGVGLGYPLTGLIADHGGVAAAYWVGTGVSLLALVLAAWAIPAPKPASRRVGAARPSRCAAGRFRARRVARRLDKGPLWGWGDPLTLSLMFVGLVLIAIWAFHELRTANPLVDLRLMRHRAVLTANVSGLLLGVAMYTSMIMMVQFVQQPTFGFGASIFVAGLTLVPMSVLSSATSRTLPWVEGRIGIRPIIPAGALAVAAASLFFALTMSSLWQAFVTMGVIGIGLGYTFAAMPGLIVGAVPSDQTSSAMGLYQVSRFVGAALGERRRDHDPPAVRRQRPADARGLQGRRRGRRRPRRADRPRRLGPTRTNRAGSVRRTRRVRGARRPPSGRGPRKHVGTATDALSAKPRGESNASPYGGLSAA